MEAVTAPTVYMPSGLVDGPPAMARDGSRTPGRDAAQSQPAETAPNGVDADDVETRGSVPDVVPEAIQLLSRPPSTLPSPSPAQTQPSPQQTQPQLQAAGPPRHDPQEAHAALRRFPSPDFDHAFRTPYFNRDMSLLADAVQQSCPEAVRRVVRDKWEKCVMGSEFHHAFLLNAIIHHTSGIIMRRAIRDFGKNMVKEAKSEIFDHLQPQDLEELVPTMLADFSDQILNNCSDEFLDKALEQRLKTIDARSLINALARAERLGYESSDVLEAQPERVVPAAQMPSHGLPSVSLNTVTQPQLAPATPAAISPTQYTQPAQHVPATTDLVCRLCWRQFQQAKPYQYHVEKQLCQKAAQNEYPFSCEACGGGFTTKPGQQYHITNAVCGTHATAAATPKPQATPQSKMPPSINYPHHPAPPVPSQTYAAPLQASTRLVESPSSSQDDPYHHLTPQKRAELQEELRQAELSFAPRFKEAEQMRDPMARRSKFDSLQNSFSTKQSIIRKKYGVRLRVRRSRVEIDEERLRMRVKHGHASPSTAETPSAKRQRSDDGSSYISRGPQTQVPAPPLPTNHLAVSQMNNSGLGGSTATAATADPTAFAISTQTVTAKEQSQSNSLSSLQRKGYRVSSHVGQGSQPASESPVERNGSASTPVVLDDSSDTETDEDIPATLPPKKAA
ncbi:hypothetical protein F4678DRAFT_422744 [Xylaria arbuscula]|nr:hypothetical protein F4678DRAFT_422744 [Xylaria arbuscula]